MSPKSAREGRGRKGAQLALGIPEDVGYLGWGERWARSRGHACIVGTDEVGRGPLAGPVVAAAAWLPPGLDEALVEAGLDDSKRLTARRREAFAERILAEARVEVAEVDAARIDEINILKASFEAMRLAVEALAARLDAPVDCLLVDGNRAIDPAPLGGVFQKPLVKGDARAVCIAAAAVVAKVHRDRLMAAYDETYPGYGFAGHAGYPAPSHLEALRRLGPCPIHRRSFRGVVDVREAG